MENKKINHNKIFSIIITLLILLSINNVSATEKITPLKDLLKKQNLKTAIGKLNYLADFSLQCGSLFEAINQVTPNKNILLASMNLQEGAIITKIMIKKTEQRKIKEETNKQQLYIKNIYLELLYKNKNTNGDYIKGSDRLNSDQKICKKFIPRFYKFLRSNSFTIKK